LLPEMHSMDHWRITIADKGPIFDPIYHPCTRSSTCWVLRSQ
jgi:hypothetical protein